MFGRVERVEWFVGGPYNVEPEDEFFYTLVEGFLQSDTAVSETMMAAELDVEVLVYAEASCWLICDQYTRTVTPQVWDCYQAISKALLATPMPTDV